MNNPAEGEDTAVNQLLSSQSQEPSDEGAASVSTMSLDETGADESGAVTDYAAMTVTELKDLARSRGLSGYSTMTKQELINLLTANDADGTA